MDPMSAAGSADYPEAQALLVTTTMSVPALRRRTFTATGLALAAWVAAPTLKAQGKPEKTRLVLAVGGKASIDYLPLCIAEQLGYFKAEGLEVEIRDFTGGARAAQALVAGEADICAGAFEHTIYLQQNQASCQAFVLQGRAPQIAVGVSTRTMGQYKRVADLRGRRIGVSAPESSTNLVVNLVLARAGVRLGEAEFIGLGSGIEALEAVREGALDAISYADPVMTMLEQKGDVRIIADTRTLKGTREVFGGEMPAACLYAATGFVQRHPQTCQALADAIVRALKWLQTAGPGDLVRTVPQDYLLGDRALYLASFQRVREAISPDGLIPEAGGATALRALASFDPSIKPAQIDLNRLFSNAFARRAKERFKL
jgi:NitT/TauT family transport system substrate-binding protein